MPVKIDGLNPAPPGFTLEHDKPLSTASASMQARFLVAAWGRMLQVMPWLVQALVQSPANALRNQRWLPPPQAGGGGGDGGDGGGDGGEGGEGDGGGGGGGEGGLHQKVRPSRRPDPL